MILTIDVTRDDIRQGDSELNSCPIALAIGRALPGSGPMVDSEYVTFDAAPPGAPLTKLPMRATRFVWAFDGETRRPLRWLRVRPFRFELTVPDGVLR